MLQRMFKAVPAAQMQVSVWTYGFALVITLAALLIVFSAADGGYCTGIALASVKKGDASNCFEFWLNRYQTLIGGILALGGAALAFGAVRSQIAQTERHADDRQKRDSNAARSVVTHALSKIHSYAMDCAEQLRSMNPKAGFAATLSSFTQPKFPEDAVIVLQEAVRHTEPEWSAQFSDLIARAQIQHARISAVAAKASSKVTYVAMASEVQSALIDAMDLFARSGRLFGYGREFLDDWLVTTEDLRRSLIQLYLDSGDWPFIKLRLDARQEAENAMKQKT